MSKPINFIITPQENITLKAGDIIAIGKQMFQVKTIEAGIERCEYNNWPQINQNDIDQTRYPMPMSGDRPDLDPLGFLYPRHNDRTEGRLSTVHQPDLQAQSSGNILQDLGIHEAASSAIVNRDYGETHLPLTDQSPMDQLDEYLTIDAPESIEAENPTIEPENPMGRIFKKLMS